KDVKVLNYVRHESTVKVLSEILGKQLTPNTGLYVWTGIVVSFGCFQHILRWVTPSHQLTVTYSPPTSLQEKPGGLLG
ncbi:MAG: hypothetical protein LM600_03045, partial [Thaumarchaeota archaeon]|nr:hypothetical protein [Nitrososphaerota archaeon]